MFKTRSYDLKHPNPIFYRSTYEILNGLWDFCFDYKNVGEKKEYFKGFETDLKINVPFSYMCDASGITERKRCDNVWYKRTINIEDITKTYLLHLEGSDYKTKVWVNNQFIGEDTGAYHRLTFDISNYVVLGENKLVIKCEDSMSVNIPRGKQRFLKKNFMCWYEETTGIYKDVWLEKVERDYIESVKITPSRLNKTIDFNVTLKGDLSPIGVNIYFKDELISSNTFDSLDFTVKLDSIEEWNVLDPKLYDIELTYKNDKVLTYCAFRDLSIKDKRIYLNDKELYQKLVLDQGYFDKGDLTPLSPLDLEKDIINSISLGFNGARKHQKREDDRYYYLADIYGFILWAEMPSAYRSSKKSRENIYREYTLLVKELYNHPSIICWTPINESWGVYLLRFRKIERDFISSLYDLTKTIDNTRFILTNDGWEHTKSDILTIHLYDQDSNKFNDKINYAINKGIVKSMLPYKYYTFVKGYEYNDQPIIISEFGGTSFISLESKDWGYGKAVKTENEYLDRLSKLFAIIKNNKNICGYCFTQLTDVKQEINGLYTLDRKLKVSSSELIKKIQEKED